MSVTRVPLAAETPLHTVLGPLATGRRMCSNGQLKNREKATNTQKQSACPGCPRPRHVPPIRLSVSNVSNGQGGLRTSIAHKGG